MNVVCTPNYNVINSYLPFSFFHFSMTTLLQLDVHNNVLNGKDLLRFRMPMPDAIFLEIFVICRFQVRFLSIYTPRDFVNSTCFIESPFIEKDKGPLKVLSNINSALNLFQSEFICN